MIVIPGMSLTISGVCSGVGEFSLLVLFLGLILLQQPFSFVFVSLLVGPFALILLFLVCLGAVSILNGVVSVLF